MFLNSKIIQNNPDTQLKVEKTRVNNFAFFK